MKVRRLHTRGNRAATSHSRTSRGITGSTTSRRDFAFFGLGAVATLASTIVPAFLQRSWQYESETFFRQLEILRDFHREASKLVAKLEAASRELDVVIQELWDYWVETAKLDDKAWEKAKAIYRKLQAAIDEVLPEMQSHYILTNAIFSLKEEEVDEANEKLRARHVNWSHEWKALEKRQGDLIATAKSAKSEDERQKLAKPVLDLASEMGQLFADLVANIGSWVEDTTDELLKKVRRR